MNRITIQLCPSTKPYLDQHYYCTPGDCTCMHAFKKGRRLENEKFFELKSKEYREGIKRKDTRYGWGMSHCTYWNYLVCNAYKLMM